MRVRKLEPNEHHRLDALELGGEWLPQRDNSHVYVAEVENEIVGFWIIQTLVHADPCWVHPKWRGRGTFSAIWNKIQEDFADWSLLSMTADSRVAKALEYLGFRFIGLIYQKVIYGTKRQRKSGNGREHAPKPSS